MSYAPSPQALAARRANAARGGRAAARRTAERVAAYAAHRRTLDLADAAAQTGVSIRTAYRYEHRINHPADT